MVEAAICFSPLRVGGRVGLSAQWIDHLFKVAVELPLLSHAIKLSLPCSAFDSVVRTRPCLGNNS